MNEQQLRTVFRQAVEGDKEAARPLTEYLRVRGAQAAAGDTVARNELEKLVYDITTDKVKDRMHRDFHFLLDRHSAASVVHEAWIRLRRRSPPPIEDPLSLYRRIAYMVRYALLDITKAQRKWDRRHHVPTGAREFDIVKARANGISVIQVPSVTAGADKDAPGFDLGQAEDPRSLNPAHLAVWSESHERVASLPDDVRQVFELHYYLGMSRRVIAEQLGVTEHRVRVLWLEALQQLGGALPGLS
jgi:RNA polymerase sigma factor (sigma-70 family)